MRLYHDALKLYYEKKDNFIVIEEGDHYIENAVIPDVIDELPVTAIAKKAFLGCKILKSVFVPDSVDSIGDFAFAMCDHLCSVSLPRKDIKLGQSIFKNDNALAEIMVRSAGVNTSENFPDISGTTDRVSSPDVSLSPDVVCLHAARLLATAPNIMSADYLIDPPSVGGGEWFRMWDQKLSDILSRKDDEGYHLYVLCGEEDLHFDYDQFVEYTRQRKSHLCILRLLNDSLLEESSKAGYIDYLLLHTSDVNNSPVFNLLANSHGDDEDYFDVLIKNGIITEKNRETLLNMLGDRHLQTKTFLINAFSADQDDFFGDLML